MRLTSGYFVGLIKNVEEGVVSNLVGKEILTIMLDTGRTCMSIIEEKGLRQVSDDNALGAIIDTVLVENASIVEQIKGGKESAIGFLVGQAMKKTQGKANPKKIGELIKGRFQNG